jgi:hypothetical protein
LICEVNNLLNVVLIFKTCTLTLIKPTHPEYRPIFLSPCWTFLCKGKSHKTGHSSKPAIIFGPSAGRFWEVSLYTKSIVGQQRSPKKSRYDQGMWRSKHPLLNGQYPAHPHLKLGIRESRSSKPVWKRLPNKGYEANHSALGPEIICNL